MQAQTVNNSQSVGYGVSPAANSTLYVGTNTSDISYLIYPLNSTPIIYSVTGNSYIGSAPNGSNANNNSFSVNGFGNTISFQSGGTTYVGYNNASGNSMLVTDSASMSSTGGVKQHFFCKIEKRGMKKFEVMV